MVQELAASETVEASKLLGVNRVGLPVLPSTLGVFARGALLLDHYLQVSYESDRVQ